MNSPSLKQVGRPAIEIKAKIGTERNIDRFVIHLMIAARASCFLSRISAGRSDQLTISSSFSSRHRRAMAVSTQRETKRLALASEESKIGRTWISGSFADLSDSETLSAIVRNFCVETMRLARLYSDECRRINETFDRRSGCWSLL